VISKQPSTASTDPGGRLTFAQAMANLNPDPSDWAPKTREAAALIERRDFDPAVALLQDVLKQQPDDVNGLYLAAEIARRRQRLEEALYLFSRCVQLTPEFQAARFRYANTLLETGQAAAALAQAEELLRRDSRNPPFLGVKAMALEMLDDFTGAVSLWQQVVNSEAPADCWVRYAHVLRTAGKRQEAIAACRKAIALDPGWGAAYWALATVNNYRLEDSDIKEMEAQLAQPRIAPASRVPLLFALGKTCGERKQYEKSFSYYARGNALYRSGLNYAPEKLTAYVERCKAVFTREFFEQRESAGCPTREPIFIVGMLRAGSTLVEQILSSHSQIEGTRELFALTRIATGLQLDMARSGLSYPAMLQQVEDAAFRELGEKYLESTRQHRRLGRAFFLDKMGHNFKQLGLIHLMLPNAKIIDVRRHPLACCFSNFTQLFANGQPETYRLSDLGMLYRDYVGLMAHFDRALPGRVHRVIYENLVANPEGEIRRLLAHLELPFEPSCLEFYKNRRAVSTISSEQVRSPIYADALEHWRMYEPWLGPLKTVLGAIADEYPNVPAVV